MKIADFFVLLRIEDKASKPLKATDASLKGLFTRANMVKIGLLAAVYAFKKMADSVISLNMNIKNLNAQGLDGNKITALGRKFEKSGGSIGEVTAAAESLNQALAEIYMPGGNYNEGLSFFNINESDNIISAMKKMREHTRNMSKDSIQFKQSFAYAKGLGISENMWRIIQNHKIALDVKSYEKITEKEMKAAEDAQKAEVEFKQAMENLSKAVVTELAPAFTELIKILTTDIVPILKAGTEFFGGKLNKPGPGGKNIVREGAQVLHNLMSPGQVVQGIKKGKFKMPSLMTPEELQKERATNPVWNFLKNVKEKIISPESKNEINNSKTSKAHNFSNVFNVNGAQDPKIVANTIKDVFHEQIKKTSYSMGYMFNEEK